MNTPSYAYFQGEIKPYDQAKVGLLTHALNYGTGAFAGVRGYWNEEEQELFIFRPKDHFIRLLNSAKLLRMEFEQTPEDLIKALKELIKMEGLKQDIYVRPLVFMSDEQVGVRLHDLTPVISMVAIPFGRYVKNDTGAHVTISSWRRLDDNVIPARGKITGGYASTAQIKTDAHLAGFDEALVLNQDGHVAEGSAMNLFMLRHGKLITPPITDNILEGITRRTVMTFASEELGLEVVERSIDRTELYLCDELILTGSAAQVTAVTRVN